MGWFLLVIGIVLVVLNLRAIKREKHSFNNIFEFEVMLGQVKKEFAETILDLQKEIEELKSNISSKQIIENIKENEIINEVLIEEPIKVDINKKKTRAKKVENNTARNSVKIEEINNLLEKGCSIEEISTKLGIGKGEVLLIKELYLK